MLILFAAIKFIYYTFAENNKLNPIEWRNKKTSNKYSNNFSFHGKYVKYVFGKNRCANCCLETVFAVAGDVVDIVPLGYIVLSTQCAILHTECRRWKQRIKAL